MDALFERRTLTKKVNIHSKSLQKNIQTSLLTQLKMQYQGRCSSEGYIHNSSDGIIITKYSLGRANYIKGGVDYDVTFQADICLPHPGQTLKARVMLKSKIGIHAKVAPLEVLLPRDLHLEDSIESFDAVKEGDDIEFEVIGCKFKQRDEEIIVVGRLKATQTTTVEAPAIIEEEPILQTNESTDGDKRVVVIADETLPKKRKLKRQEGVST